MTAMTTSTASFTGADVDGLDKVAQECTQAAQVCDEVRMACEAIVAAASFFGPFGAAFIAYLKGVVIPWLQKVSQALQLFAKVLSAHSASQRDASSASTSLPSYTTPTALPATSTSNYPVLPTATPTVSTSSGVGGTSAGHTAAGGATVAGGAKLAQSPAVQGITAVTALLTAIAKLENPSGTSTSAPVLGTTPLGGTTAVTSPSGSLTGTTVTPTTGLTGVTGTSATGLGGSSGISGVSTANLPAGDTVGTLSVPVAISPDGHITPLLQTTGTPTTTGSPALATPHDSTTITHQPTPLGAASDIVKPSTAVPTAHIPTAGSGGGSGGGTSGGGSGLSGGGGTSGSGTLSATPQVIGMHAATIAPAHAAAAPHPAAGDHPVAGHAAASHDGLYSGLGQATGIGAGGAALAKATLREARQRAEGGLLSGLPLPFDAGSDGAAQLRIFDTELGG